jgi:hypothetical protein
VEEEEEEEEGGVLTSAIISLRCDESSANDKSKDRTARLVSVWQLVNISVTVDRNLGVSTTASCTC